MGGHSEIMMEMKALRFGTWVAAAVSTLCLVGGVGAQESLDKGKSPAQLFASDCSICHKSAQGLAKTGGLLGLDNFLRTHYTASRETASAIANYLKSVDAAAAGRATRRTAKGDGKAPPDGRKKSGVMSGGTKGAGRKPDAAPDKSKPSVSRSSEPKQTEILAPEPKSTESRPLPAGEAKPAEGAKPK
jgi:hypothetical protein